MQDIKQELLIYKPISLTKEEKAELEDQMTQAFKSFCRASNEKYGFANVIKLRDQYKKNKTSTYNPLWADPTARKWMDWMIENEDRIISANIRLANKACLKFLPIGKELNLTYGDLVQVSVMAIYNAMYQFDNSKSCFSTYVVWAIKNALSTYVKNENSQKGITRKITALKSQVASKIAEGVSFDEAVNQLKDSGVEINGSTIERLKFAMGLITDQISQDIPAPVVVNEKHQELEYMKKAIEQTKLSDLERNLVEAHLRGDHSYRKMLSETINPATGNCWTRQRLSQIFIDACTKIRNTYESQNPKQVA